MEPIRVECYAGCKADQQPIAVHLEGQRRRVLGIADRWYDPDSSYFRIRLDDGHQYLIRHDRREDVWLLVKQFPTDA